MTTTGHRPVPTEVAERATQPQAAAGVAVDTAALLDHRTRAATLAAPDAPAGRYLAVEDGEAERLIPLTRPIVHIGRGLVCDVRLEDPHVSRRHAIVALRGEGVRVLDDRSANGTWVNGREVSVAELGDGDVIRVGRAVLRYVEVRASRGSAHARPAAPRPRGARAPRRFPIARAARPAPELGKRHGSAYTHAAGR